jgi:4-hydroxybenzoate polyprenyltransferase
MEHPISSWHKIVRWSEWYDSKLPFIVMIAYWAAVRQSVTAVWEPIARIAVYGASLLALGYLLNDLSDISIDKAAGKKRAVHRIPKAHAWLVAAMLTVIVVGSLWPYLLRPSLTAELSVAASIFLASAYSLRPFRLKERGWVGLVAASAAQRSLPAIVAAISLDIVEPATVAMTLVFFMNGLRYIILHQVIDAESDHATHVHTFMRDRGLESTGAELLSLLLAGEVAVLAMLPLAFRSTLWWFGIVAWPHCLYWLWQLALHGRQTHPLTYDRMPLQTFYFLVWPASLAAAAALVNPIAWPLLISEIVWKRRLWQPLLRRHV